MSLEVGNQHFDAAVGRHAADLLDGHGEHARAAQVVVVAIDAGHHRVLQSQLRHRIGNAPRLVKINRPGMSLGNGAEAAAPGADVAQQHEGGGAMVPALADVGTLRRLAHRVQAEPARQLLERVIVLAHGRARLQPLRLGPGTPRRRVDLDQGRGHGKVTLYDAQRNPSDSPLVALCSVPDRGNGHARALNAVEHNVGSAPDHQLPDSGFGARPP